MEIDQTLLTRDEVRGRLGAGGGMLSLKGLQRIIDAGFFPRGTGNPAKWYVSDVETYLYLRSRGCFQASEEKSRKKSGADTP